MCRLLGGVAEALKPLVTRLRELIFASRVVQIDETTVRYLDRDHDRTQGGYFWAYAGDAAHRYVYYEFQPSRSCAGPAAWLSTYRGYVQSDGYSVYESLAKSATERWTHVGCWAHVRRKFDEALLTTSHPILHESLAAIQQLYALEIQTATCSSADRQVQRAAQARPIVERLHTRWLAVRGELRPSTKLAEAVNYGLHRWPTLLRYLDDGDLSIDTNHVEREIRPLAIGRSNWLFLGHERAGATASALYTVLQSARLQQVDLLPYLTDVLRGLPAVGSGDLAGVDAYLPDRWLMAHPQHRLIERQRESQEAQRRRRVRHATRRAGTAG